MRRSSFLVGGLHVRRSLQGVWKRKWDLFHRRVAGGGDLVEGSKVGERREGRSRRWGIGHRCWVRKRTVRSCLVWIEERGEGRWTEEVEMEKAGLCS